MVLPETNVNPLFVGLVHKVLLVYLQISQRNQKSEYLLILPISVFKRVKMVHITIEGRPDKAVEYPDHSNFEKVLGTLIAAFGPGVLKQNGQGVLSITTGDYQFHVTARQGKFLA